MTRKQPRVPGMRESTPNRRQRRHPGATEDEPLVRDEDARRDLEAQERRAPTDVPSPRAKSSGHRKKTADNWNQ